MAKPKVLPYGKMEHFSIISRDLYFIFIRARTYTRGNSPNFGHFSRDLGQNLRVTFRDRTPI